MTTIDDTTKNVLAMITARQAACRDSAPTWEQVSDPTITTLASQNVASTESAISKKAKTSKSKKGDDFKELNITRIYANDGSATYRVQIRRTVNGKSRSLCQTFRHLKNAKKWRDKKLAEIELHGFPLQIVTETTIADVIADRLTRGKKLGKSALQNIEYIQNHVFGRTKVSLLTQQQIYAFAETLLDGDRTPQTVAGYMTHLTATLKWAHRRGTLLPIEAVSLAMETLWEDEVPARSEERNRRPQLAELDAILTALAKKPPPKASRRDPRSICHLLRTPAGRDLSAPLGGSAGGQERDPGSRHEASAQKEGQQCLLQTATRGVVDHPSNAPCFRAYFPFFRKVHRHCLSSSSRQGRNPGSPLP